MNMSKEAAETKEVVLRELESMLRKKLGEELELVGFRYESLLPSGENYGSSIFKVRAVVKNAKDTPAGEEKVLELVAKMLPPTDFQRLVFDSPYSFRKEAFLYEELIPSYRQLERELGVEDDEVFDIVPEFYGARYSLKSEEDFDDDAVILMQNLKVQGYYTGQRREGLDFEHAKTAIKALARFHALGMAMKYHKPKFFEILKFRSKCLEFPETTGFENISNMILNMLSEDSETSRYADAVKGAMAQESATNWTIPPAEPWSTIVHADFWVNNIMFHKNPKSNQVDDVKFVDFQNYLFLSPLRELTFFLMVSTNAETMEYNFDELLDIYYDKFIGVLGMMKCNTEPFTRDKFDERLNIDAYEEFPHCPFMLKMMSADVDSNEKFDSIEKFASAGMGSLGFKDRLRRCVKKYGEKGWLDQPECYKSS